MSRNPHGRAASRHLKLRRIQSRHGGEAFPRSAAAATALGLLLLLVLAPAARAQLPQSATPAARGFDNPVIPGMASDPSVERVGSDYYLVTSTFEYFPGVPVYHSRDLIHWRIIGHALTRPGQLPLVRLTRNGGIWATTIREHGGTFYMVTTL